MKGVVKAKMTVKPMSKKEYIAALEAANAELEAENAAWVETYNGALESAYQATERAEAAERALRDYVDVVDFCERYQLIDCEECIKYPDGCDSCADRRRSDYIDGRVKYLLAVAADKIAAERTV
jgi:hypothetical protein